MRTIKKKRRNWIIFFSIFVIFLIWTKMKDNKDGVSTDIRALQNIVRLSISPKDVKWEIFGTPEYVGGVPGPTDFITLVAEVTPVDNSTVDMAKNGNCHALHATLKDTAEALNGFSCLSAGKVLIYLRIADYSRT